jgi:peptidoglycan-associated lipoprotein
MIKDVRRAFFAMGAALVLGAVGCDDSKPEPEVPPQPTATPEPATQPTSKSKGREEDRANVGIDPRIREMCNLPEPRFDFDSASLSPQARDVLDKLAACFVTGPGKGKGMKVVGHADPRGETEYNFALGQKRAGSVAGYITQKGVGDDRVESSSRGELDATGTDDAGYAKDRRVDILLAE